MIRKIDSNIFSLTILKVTTFSRIRQVSYHMGAVSLLKTDIKMPFTAKTQSKVPQKYKVKRRKNIK